MNDADAVSPQKRKLTDNFGAMHKRNREAIIQFHKPNKEKNPKSKNQDDSLPSVMNNADAVSPQKIKLRQFWCNAQA